MCVACAGGGSAKPSPSPDLYVLTAANELIGATVTGRVVVRRQLARARRGTSPSQRLALDGGRLFALVRRDVPPDRIVLLDAATARVRASRVLPADFRARVLVAGRGRIFVAGNRVARRINATLAEEDSAVLELDRAGRVLRRFTVREADGHDWWVAAAALSPDGGRLAISYHGGCTGEAPDLCTGGADVVDVGAGRREPCIEPYPRSGCVNAHGQVDFAAGGLLAATGSPEILLLDPAGHVAARLDTRLGNSHVMDFTLDRERGDLVAAGPCQHFGGLAALRLPTGPVRLLAPPTGPNARVCGDRVGLLPRIAIVAGIRTATADPLAVGRVLLVDRASGRIRARIALRAEPVDVLAVRPSG